MKTASYKRNLNRTYLIMEEDLWYEEDYQMRMIKENQIEGLLCVHGRGVDGSSQYSFDISGKVSVKAMYEKAKLHKDDMTSIISDLMTAVRAVRNHMLDMNCILLSTDYIFYEEGKFYFCYYPLNKEDLCEEFHRLSEYFVSQVDYEEKEGVYMAYELHKATMEENYSLEKVIGRIENKEMTADRAETKIVDEEEEIWETDGEKEKNNYEKWSDIQAVGSGYIRESHSLFSPVKKMMKRKRKAKWGEWDELLLDEDDL